MKLEEATRLALQGKLTEAEEENKKYLSEMEEEVKEFFNKIDFTPLLEEIRKRVNDNSVVFEQEPTLGKFNFDRWTVKYSSQNVSDKCGIMSGIYEECYIKNFGGGISKDKETNELFFWTQVHFSFQYVNGGSNGAEIFNATYTDEKGWVFGE